MMGKTHVVFGALTWAAVAHYYRLPLQLGHLAAAAGAALLPDIDHPQSSFGRQVPFLSQPISRLFGHRGFTHSLLAVLLLVLALLHWAPHWSGYATPLAAGYVSHLVGDFVTSTGVCFFWPNRTRYCLGLMKTDGKVEDMIRICLGLGLVCVVFTGRFVL